MKRTIALLALTALIMATAGCAGGAGKTASVEDIFAFIKEKMVQDLKDAGYEDADFEAEELPGYTVTDLKGEGAEHLLADLDKDLVEAGFVIKASMMLNSDQIVVIKAVSGKVGAVRRPWKRSRLPAAAVGKLPGRSGRKGLTPSSPPERFLS